MISAAEMYRRSMAVRAEISLCTVSHAVKIIEDEIMPALLKAADEGDLIYSCQMPKWEQKTWLRIKQMLEGDDTGYRVRQYQEVDDIMLSIEWGHAVSSKLNIV